MKRIGLILLVVLISACSTLTPPKEQPVIEDKVKGAGIMSITAERKAVIVVDPKEPVYICTEPSPDVAENITSSLKAIADASLKNPDSKNMGVSAEIAKSFGTSISPLFMRSQGIQYFRDGAKELCIAKMTKQITNEEYLKRFDTISERSFELIKLEIPKLEELKSLSILQQTQRALNEIDFKLNSINSAVDRAESAAVKAEVTTKPLDKPITERD